METLHDLCNEWLGLRETAVEYNTFEFYTNIINASIKKIIGSRSINEISIFELQNSLNSLQRENQYSQRTCIAIKNTLSLVYKYAIKKGVIDTNLAVDLEIPKDAGKKDRDCLTKLEEKMVLTFYHIYSIFPCFLYYTGLRRGEALAIKRRDIDLANRKIYVSKSIFFKKNKPFIKSTKSKNGNREVLVPDAFYNQLQDHVRLLDNDDYLFTQITTGSPHTKSSYRKMWDRWWNDLNVYLGGYKEFPVIRRITAHMFRHTYVTKLLEEKIPDIFIAYTVGHGSSEYTKRAYM